MSPESEGSDAHTVPSATVVSAAREDMGPLEASLRVPPTGLCAEGHNLSPQLTIFISPRFSSFLMKTLTIKLGFPLEQKLAFPRRFTVQSEPLAACQSETLSPHTHDRDVLPDPASQSRSAEEASAWVVGAEVPRSPVCPSAAPSPPSRLGVASGTGTVLGAWAPGSHAADKGASSPYPKSDRGPASHGVERSGTRWLQWHFQQGSQSPRPRLLSSQARQRSVLASCLLSLGPLWPHVPRRAQQCQCPVPACVCVILEGHRPSTTVSPGSRFQTALGTQLLEETSSPVSNVHWILVSPISDFPFILILHLHIFVSEFWCDRPRGDT